MVKEFSINNVVVSWLGHASVMIKTEEKIIYIDPFVGNYEKANIILVSHDHFDHCDLDKISQATSPDTVIIAPQKTIEKIGKGKTISDGQTIEEQGVKITAVPAYNPNKQFHPKGVGVGFVVEVNGVRVYHAGDTDLIPEMKDLTNIDIALLPMGGVYTMDVNEALEANRIIQPKHAIPIHYGTIENLAKTSAGFEAPNVVVLDPI